MEHLFIRFLCVVACILYGVHAVLEDEPEKKVKKAKKKIKKADDGCPEGWMKYSGDSLATCFYFSSEEDSHALSASHCEDMDAQLAYAVPGSGSMQFISETVMSLDSDFWFGIKKDEGYNMKYTWADKTEVPENALPDSIKNYKPFNEQCVFMSSFDDHLGPDSCDSNYRYICQKKFECPANRFGSQCERQCHCMGPPCDTTEDNVTCRDGCQREWFGPGCDKPRRQPEINYYCIDIPRMIKIRLITNGFETINVLTASEDMLPGGVRRGQGRRRPTTYFSCRPTNNWDPNESPGRYSIIIKQSDVSGGVKATHMCSMGPRADSWVIEVRESPTVSLEQDYRVVVSCNFSNADHLNIEQTIQLPMSRLKEPSVPTMPPNTFADDITLTFVDYQTGETINGTAQLGTPVFLRLQYGIQEGSLIKALQPWTCFIGPQTDIPVHRISPTKYQIIMATGCPHRNATISPFIKKTNQTLETKWFPLFELNGETSLKVQCTYRICFYEDECEQPTCKKNRRRRDVSGRHERVLRAAGQGKEPNSSEPVVSQTVKVVRPKDNQLNNSA